MVKHSHLTEDNVALFCIKDLELDIHLSITSVNHYNYSSNPKILTF